MWHCRCFGEPINSILNGEVSSEIETQDFSKMVNDLKRFRKLVNTDENAQEVLLKIESNYGVFLIIQFLIQYQLLI